MKRILTSSIAFAGAMVALTWGGSIAHADPFALSGTYHSGDEFQLKYQNFEVTANNTGQNLYGLVYITSIVDVSTGTTVWTQGGNGQGQIAGTFNNFVSNGASGPPNGQEVTFTGGDVKLYYDPTVVHTPFGAVGTNANPDGDGTFTQGSLWLGFAAVPGIKPADPTVTLDSTGNFTTNPISGTGFGYLDVTGGSFAKNVIAGKFGPGADSLLQSDINSATIPGDPWPIESHDPVSFLFQTPEPTSFALLSMGLVSLLGAARMRRRGTVCA